MYSHPKWISRRCSLLRRLCLDKMLCLQDSWFKYTTQVINTGVYCKKLKKLCHAIQNKWHEILIWAIMLIHDNARPHNFSHDFRLKTILSSFLQLRPSNKPSSCVSKSEIFFVEWGFHEKNMSNKLFTCGLFQRGYFSTMKEWNTWCPTITVDKKWWKLCSTIVYSKSIHNDLEIYFIVSSFVILPKLRYTGLARTL